MKEQDIQKLLASRQKIAFQNVSWTRVVDIGGKYDYVKQMPRSHNLTFSNKYLPINNEVDYLFTWKMSLGHSLILGPCMCTTLRFLIHVSPVVLHSLHYTFKSVIGDTLRQNPPISTIRPVEKKVGHVASELRRGGARKQSEPRKLKTV